MKRCKKCGEPIVAVDEFCPECEKTEPFADGGMLVLAATALIIPLFILGWLAVSYVVKRL